MLALAGVLQKCELFTASEFLHRIASEQDSLPVAHELAAERALTDASVKPEYIAWLKSLHPVRNGVGGNEAWNAGVAWASEQDAVKPDVWRRLKYLPGTEQFVYTADDGEEIILAVGLGGVLHAQEQDSGDDRVVFGLETKFDPALTIDESVKRMATAMGWTPPGQDSGEAVEGKEAWEVTLAKYAAMNNTLKARNFKLEAESQTIREHCKELETKIQHLNAHPQRAMSDEDLLPLLRKCLSSDEFKALTFERWKDGIEIDVPTTGASKLCRAIEAHIRGVES